MRLRVNLRRYLFYAWLFRDAEVGTELERANALRHNKDQAKWLPLYFTRWSILGGALAVLETLVERLGTVPLLSGALAIALIFVVLQLLLTAIYWAFLRRPR
jgi:hypothetical protein